MSEPGQPSWSVSRTRRGTERCSTMTALGRPVDPEVHSTCARARESTGTGSATGSQSAVARRTSPAVTTTDASASADNCRRYSGRWPGSTGT